MKQKTSLKSNIKNIVKVIIGEKALKRRKRRQRKTKMIQAVQPVQPVIGTVSNLGAVASAGQSILNTISQKQTEALTNINKKLEELERRKETYSRLYRDPVKVGLSDYGVGHHSKSTSTVEEITSPITGSQNVSLMKGQQEGNTDRFQQSSLLARKGDRETDMSVYEPMRDDEIIGMYQGGGGFQGSSFDINDVRMGNSLSSSSSTSSSSGGSAGGGGIMGEEFTSSPSQTGLAFGIAQVAEQEQELPPVIQAIVQTKEALKGYLERLTLPRLMEEALTEGVDFTNYVGLSGQNYYLKGKDKQKKASKKAGLIKAIIQKKFE